MDGRIIPLPERPCVPCRDHRHASCWGHLAAIGLVPHEPCSCDCHQPKDNPALTAWAIDDMAKHSTLAEHVKADQAVRRGSLTNHAIRGKRAPHN